MVAFNFKLFKMVHGLLVSGNKSTDLLFFIGVLLILAIFLLVFWLSTLFLPWWIGLFLVSFVFYFSIHRIIKCIVFAGSFFLIKHSAEHHYSKLILKDFLDKLQKLEKYFQVISGQAEESDENFGWENKMRETLLILVGLKHIIKKTEPKKPFEKSFCSNFESLMSFLENETFDDANSQMVRFVDMLDWQRNDLDFRPSIGKEAFSALQKTIKGLHVTSLRLKSPMKWFLLEIGLRDCRFLRAFQRDVLVEFQITFH